MITVEEETSRTFSKAGWMGIAHWLKHALSKFTQSMSRKHHTAVVEYLDVMVLEAQVLCPPHPLISFHGSL